MGAIFSEGAVQVAAGVITAAIVALVVALGRWFKSHQDMRRRADTVSRYLFDQPADPGTGTPGTTGWTTVIDRDRADTARRLTALEQRRRG